MIDPNFDDVYEIENGFGIAVPAFYSISVLHDVDRNTVLSLTHPAHERPIRFILNEQQRQRLVNLLTGDLPSKGERGNS
ncbi:hypothetical protein JFK97_10890 [Chromobacterium phragmitis]|uniref:hypothetical protein n=1 Tax=Chromobacterium amazonense TaxID=1382803 RepID=UPI0021B823A4|nr:hypothetical protein [Chromobacterium amazonense]MBM2884893.1 hypothetical protein [Chromobacterium amazonense]MDE1714760.1 hypothetical protein [Chromobacterium amazonense]